MVRLGPARAVPETRGEGAGHGEQDRAVETISPIPRKVGNAGAPAGESASCGPSYSAVPEKRRNA